MNKRSFIGARGKIILYVRSPHTLDCNDCILPLACLTQNVNKLVEYIHNEYTIFFVFFFLQDVTKSQRCILQIYLCQISLIFAIQ